LTTNFYGGWAPRFGVAYSPDDGRTAIRAAYGLSYYRDNFGANGGTLERNFPFFPQISLVTPNQFTPFRSLSDGLPGFPSIPRTPTMAPPPGFAVFFIPPGDKPNKAHMFNAGIQRQLRWNSVVEVAYVGTRGSNIFRSRNINIPDPGPGAVNPRRPFFNIVPNITAINQRRGDGRSWYDALQVKLDKRFSHGLQALVAYTYSKSVDTTTIAGMHPALAERKTRSSSFKQGDVPHNLSLSWTYDLPIGPDRRLTVDGPPIVRVLVEGWAVNGITSYQSGEPLIITVASPRLNTGGTANLADMTCGDARIIGEVNQWFDTNCFANPAEFVIGNYEVGQVRGPTFFNTDFSIFKRTRLGGSRLLELRIEMFNVFNRAHLANPGTSFEAGNFGRISSTRFPSREIQLGARFLF
jgi:hypothetical protein